MSLRTKSRLSPTFSVVSSLRRHIVPVPGHSIAAQAMSFCLFCPDLRSESTWIFICRDYRTAVPRLVWTHLPTQVSSTRTQLTPTMPGRNLKLSRPLKLSEPGQKESPTMPAQKTFSERARKKDFKESAEIRISCQHLAEKHRKYQDQEEDCTNAKENHYIWHKSSSQSGSRSFLNCSLEKGKRQAKNDEYKTEKSEQSSFILWSVCKTKCNGKKTVDLHIRGRAYRTRGRQAKLTFIDQQLDSYCPSLTTESSDLYSTLYGRDSHAQDQRDNRLENGLQKMPRGRK